jgi:hypothetical protein
MFDRIQRGSIATLLLGYPRLRSQRHTPVGFTSEIPSEFDRGRMTRQTTSLAGKPIELTI